MKSIALIPARYASTRFPGKPLVDLAGKSMILRVYEQVKKAKKLDEVYVTTDDERIYKALESVGAKVVYSSPECRNGTERCFESYAQLGNFDILLNVQGDEPFIKPEDIDRLIGAFENHDVQIASLKNRIYSQEEFENPNRVKLVCNERGEALYFSRSPIPYNAEVKDLACFKHIGIYAFRTNILDSLRQLEPHPIEQAESLEQLRWLLAGYSIFVLETEYDPIGIDHPDDLEKVRALYTKNV